MRRRVIRRAVVQHGFAMTAARRRCNCSACVYVFRSCGLVCVFPGDMSPHHPRGGRRRESAAGGGRVPREVQRAPPMGLGAPPGPPAGHGVRRVRVAMAGAQRPSPPFATRLRRAAPLVGRRVAPGTSASASAEPLARARAGSTTRPFCPEARTARAVLNQNHCDGPGVPTHRRSRLFG